MQEIACIWLLNGAILFLTVWMEADLAVTDDDQLDIAMISYLTHGGTVFFWNTRQHIHGSMAAEQTITIAVSSILNRFLINDVLFTLFKLRLLSPYLVQSS